MERDANYALVGLSTLILVLGIAIFGVWLARISFNRDYALYDIIFQGPINGLSQGIRTQQIKKKEDKNCPDRHEEIYDEKLEQDYLNNVAN